MTGRFNRTGLATAIWVFAAGTLLAAMDARTRGLLQNSMLLAAWTTAVTIPLGLLLATLLLKWNIPGRRLALILLISSLFLPLYLVATAWQSALGLQGWVAELWTFGTEPAPILAGLPGAVFLHSAALIPVVTLIMAVGVASVERELEEDALLYASPLTVLVRVTWRRSLSAVLAAVIWVFIVCLGEMTVTDLLQIRTFAEEIYVQTAGGAIWDLAGGQVAQAETEALSSSSFTFAVLFIGLLLLPAAVWCLLVVVRWQQVQGMTRWTITPARGSRAIGAGVVIFLLALVGLPLASLFYHTGVFAERTDGGFVAHWSLTQGLVTVARAPVRHGQELLHTAVVGIAAASAATCVAAALGVWAVFHSLGKATAAIVAAAMAAVPGPLVGLWIIRTLNQPPESPLSFLAVLYDEAVFGFAPWLAQTLRVLPFAVVVVVPAMIGTPRSLLEAAALDGAGTGQQVMHVFLPMHWRSLLAGWLVALVLAVGELPATILVAPPGVTPLSVRIFNLLHYGVDDQLAGLVVFVWAAVLVLTAAILLLGRRIMDGMTSGAIRTTNP